MVILYAVWGLASSEVLWIMDRCSRWGKQEHGIFLGSHHFLLIMKHTPPPLVLPASAVIRRHYSSVRDWGREPCFRQTKNVTVPYVPLETYPGSKIVHLILQELDISEQDARQRTVSPFSQFVADPSTFPVALLDPSPPGAIQVAIVLLHIPEYLQWPWWVGGKVSWNRLV